MVKITLKKEPRLDVKHKAFSYQAEAVQAIRNLDYAAIFHEQGLGKSKIAIDLMLYWLEKRVIDTVLFIVKKGLIKNWEKELAAHTFMKPKIISQNRRSNYYAFNAPSRLMLAHFEVLTSELDRFKLFLKARDVAIIVDESAKIKNPESTITKAFFELAPLFKKRIIMTGTPVANRPYDIWSQIWFLDQGKSLGNNFSKFKHDANLSNELAENHLRRGEFEGTIESIFSCISTFAVRETKSSGIIELPQKIIKTVRTDWEKHQYNLYRQVKEEMRAVVVREGIPTEDNAEPVLKRLLRLVQVASNPLLVDESYHSTPGKVETLEDIVSAACQKGEKCIIWSSFTNNVDWLTKRLSTFGSCKVHGKCDIERRNRTIDQFLNDPCTRILVATPQAAKEGLTLTVSNHVIFYDRTFSLDDYLQSQDRIHRISQKKICYIYNLIMNDSIDEWVDILLKGKHLAAQLSQGDISLEYYQSQISYDFGTIVGNILGINQ
jgi:SNF2 family DNA or RNA helicase